MRSKLFVVWYRLAPAALLTGCLVTFNDYPEGDIALRPGLGGSSGTAGTASDLGAQSGSGASGGSETGAVSGSGGGSSGGGAGSAPALGGSDVGGTDTGGTAPIDVGGTTGDAGASAEAGAGASAGGGASGGVGGALMVDDNPYLIDNFEDGDDLIFERQGRRGAWFVLNDGKGTQTPEVGAKVLPGAFMLSRNGSERGMHTSGGPFQTWGALIGTTLADDSTYDLTPYKGLKLWVRSNSTAPTAAKQVRLNFVTPATTSGSSCKTCGDHFGFDIPLTSKWVQVEVAFSKLKQSSSGIGPPRPTAVDLKSVTALQFQFPQAVSFDFWLDDIELY